MVATETVWPQSSDQQPADVIIRELSWSQSQPECQPHHRKSYLIKYNKISHMTTLKLKSISHLVQSPEEIYVWRKNTVYWIDLMYKNVIDNIWVSFARFWWFLWPYFFSSFIHSFIQSLCHLFNQSVRRSTSFNGPVSFSIQHSVVWRYFFFPLFFKLKW